MKRFFYSLLLLVTASPLTAQVLYSEGFEYMQSTNFCCGWGVTGNPGSSPWHSDIFYYTGTDCFPEIGNYTIVAGISGLANPPAAPCSYAAHDSNVLLYTPLIHLNGVPYASLSYDSYFTKKVMNGRSERATVEISTDSGASWTVLANAPMAPGHRMVPGYANLSAYTNYPSVRLGFRYSDSGQHMTGWMIDNVKIYVPAQNDLALTAVSPADSMLTYLVSPDSVQPGGTVFNQGAQPVTAFHIYYQSGSGPVYEDSVTGVNIPSFGTYTFQHHKPFVVPGIGRYPLKIWVRATDDIAYGNDSATIMVHGASFIPNKKITVEAGTGSWYPFAPQTYVSMDQLRLSDYPVTLIALHAADAIEEPVYKHYISGVYSATVPYILFDRRYRIPTNRIVGVAPYGTFYIFDSTEVLAQFNIQRQYFGFGDITIDPSVSGNHLNITASLKPAIDLPGDYRLALVLTEDDVHHIDPQYNQVNFFSGGAYGTAGGYENLANPVPGADMHYNYVARSISPSPDGKAGCLPTTMQHDIIYTCALQATIDPAWIWRSLTAHVLLIRQADSTVLNSKSIKISDFLGLPNTSTTLPGAVLYPNPADQSVNIVLYLPKIEGISISVTDITGRLIYAGNPLTLEAGRHQLPLRTDMLVNGVYLIQLRIGNSLQMMKLDVIH